MNKEIEEALRVGDDRKVEEYIKQLENEIKMYKDFKEIANMKMGDRNVIRAIKNYKTLDKVTDKLKEDIEKYNKELLKDSIMSIKNTDLTARILQSQKILNIIEERR